MEWSILELMSLVLLGVGAAFMNVFAGGGSLLTVPVLISYGLPAALANGSNRVGLMIGLVFSVVKFKRKNLIDFRLGSWLALPAAIGALFGAHFAIQTSDAVYRRILAAVMIVVLAAVFVNPASRLKVGSRQFSSGKRILAALVFFLIGVYGGFVQIGVGFLVMTALITLTGYDLLRVNALKSFVVFAYLTPTLLVFLWHGQIDWLAGLIMAVGMSIGNWLGAVLQIKKGERLIKIIFAIVTLVIAANMVFDLW